MDVVVTIPKSRLAIVEQEEREVKEALKSGADAFFFWRFARCPKNLSVGNRIYFVWNGAVRAYHVVDGFDKNLVCDTTGQRYDGFCVTMNPAIHNLRKPIPMRGFQGFRYFKENEK